MSQRSPLVLALGFAFAAPLGAQGTGCRVLCAPAVTLMLGAVRTHLLDAPEVRPASGGPAHRLPAAWNTEVMLAVAARTPVPRLGAFASTQWLPNAAASRNPFTLYTADELGAHVRANAPTAVLGLSYALVVPPQTGGWLDLAANVGDLFSQAARPRDRSSYTHKLDLDLVAHAHPFARVPAHAWLNEVSAYGILDYVATGLPRAGDEIPEGRRFVTDARPAALLVGLALPLIPAEP